MDKTRVQYKDRYKVKNPNRAKHLEQYRWKKGETGNPEGRPTGSFSIKETLLVYLRRHPEEVEAIIVALVKQGKIGNIAATKEIMDRVDGKVAETHKIEGELPITITFVPAQNLIENKPKEIETAKEIEAAKEIVVVAE